MTDLFLYLLMRCALLPFEKSAIAKIDQRGIKLLVNVNELLAFSCFMCCGLIAAVAPPP